jgi:alkylation response protein AidB-like acyl-CoA dehydrogenase
MAQGAFEMGLSYARQREQFGRPIGSFQAIQFKLADMATEIEAARNLVYKAAWLKDQDRPFDLRHDHRRIEDQPAPEVRRIRAPAHGRRNILPPEIGDHGARTREIEVWYLIVRRSAHTNSPLSFSLSSFV